MILLVSTLENVLRAVWRICILTLGCKGLNLTWNVIFSFFTSPPLPPLPPPFPLLSEVGVHFFTLEAGINAQEKFTAKLSE